MEPKGKQSSKHPAFAKAIEACHRAGGGRVVVPAGEWFTGPIHLKSHVNLFLEEGAVSDFSDNPNDYLPAVMTPGRGWNAIITRHLSMHLNVRM